MKFTFLSLMLLVSTASFGNTIYSYDGVSPLKYNDKCSVELDMISDNTMGSIEIFADTLETGGLDVTVQHYPRARTIDFINDKNFSFELEYPSASKGLVQKSSSNGVMTYKIKGTENKVKITMKGTKINNIKSLILEKRHHYFLGKTYTSQCNNLVLRSATLK